MADTWDFATAVEACVALGRADEAMRWADLYAKSPDTGAFELASTLRQLTEIWGLRDRPRPDPFADLVDFLEAELLRQGRGRQEIVLTRGAPASAPFVTGKSLDYEQHLLRRFPDLRLLVQAGVRSLPAHRPDRRRRPETRRDRLPDPGP